MTVEDIYIDVMFAIPSRVLGVPRSIQVPFQDIEVYTRKLAAGNNYVEIFTSISPPVGAICCAPLGSSEEHSINTNRELYALGGGPKGVKTWAFSLLIRYCCLRLAIYTSKLIAPLGGEWARSTRDLRRQQLGQRGPVGRVKAAVRD